MKMSKNPLELLFESKTKVKILKFLFRNMGASFSSKELALKVRESRKTIKSEVFKLIEMGLIKIKR